MVKKRLKLTLLTLLLMVGSCAGGGGSGGGGVDDVEGVSPAHDTFLGSGEVLEFVLRNNRSDGAVGTYTIFVYSNADRTELFATVEGLEEDENKIVRWSPDVTLEKGRPYWWNWRGVFTTSSGEETLESPLFTFRTLIENEPRPTNPTNNGVVDINSAVNPGLGVSNIYTFGDISIAYDFELFDDPGATTLIGSVYAVPSQNDKDTTIGTVPIDSLEENRTYFWRARAIVSGVPWGWSDLASFTVSNVCANGIGRSYYAERVIKWTQATSCNQIVRNNPLAALGSPDASGFVNQDDPGWGYLSIGIGGTLILEMGATVADGPGPDIRLWEYVSTEPVEIFAALTEAGPWFSLSSRWCGDSCDFDLGFAGLSYARYFKIKDLWPASIGCYQTAGADVDSLQALNVITDPGQCVTQ